MRRSLGLALGLLLALAALATPIRAGAATARVTVGLCTLEADGALANALGPLAEQDAKILARLETDLGAARRGPVPDGAAPARTTGRSGLARLDALGPVLGRGLFVPEARTGVIRVALADRYPFGTVEAVLAHETTHMLLHDAVPRGLPRWLEEGIATWEERSFRLEDIVVYSTSLLTSDLPRLAELDQGFHASEGEGAARLCGLVRVRLLQRATARRPAFVRDLVRESRNHETARGVAASDRELARGERIGVAEPEPLPLPLAPDPHGVEHPVDRDHGARDGRRDQATAAGARGPREVGGGRGGREISPAPRVRPRPRI